MAKFDFSNLYNQIPEALESMSSVFNSHELILHLAQKNQKEYINALFAYRDTEHPFMHVHKQISSHLRKYESDKLKSLDHKPSKDIFGKENTSLTWEKNT